MNDGFWRQKLGASAVGLMVFVVLTQAKVVYALEPKAQDVRKLDDCVVGAWRQTSNDQAEVMSELFPGMPVTRVETSNVIFKFNPDGTYASDRVHIETSTISQSSDRPR